MCVAQILHKPYTTLHKSHISWLINSLRFIKQCFTIVWVNNGGIMKESHVFKGVKLTEKQVKFVQAMADKSYEGNFSMALRVVISKAMKAA